MQEKLKEILNLKYWKQRVTAVILTAALSVAGIAPAAAQDYAKEYESEADAPLARETALEESANFELESVYEGKGGEQILDLGPEDEELIENEAQASALLSSGKYQEAINSALGTLKSSLGTSLRTTMKNRASTVTMKETVTLTVSVSASEARSELQAYYSALNSVMSSFPNDVKDEAVKQTGSLAEGDYLYYSMASITWSYSLRATATSIGSGNYRFSFPISLRYDMKYNADAAMERTVTSTVQRVLAQLNVASAGSQYAKAKKIYDYICKNVTYDYTNLKNSSYLLKHSAYAALINKTAVCQGYALLLYRMLEAVGISTRIMTGTSNGEEHMWNVACLDGQVYFLDATWDAPLYKTGYRYFVKKGASFPNHSFDARSQSVVASFGITAVASTISLSKPKLSSVSNIASGVQIKWEKVSGASMYRVFRKSGTGKWKRLGDTTATSFTDKTAKSGTTYTYTVRCVSRDGKSYESSYDTKGKTIRYLKRPTPKAANTSSGVKVSWSKTTGASGYYVYRKTNGKYVRIAAVKGSGTLSYLDKTAKSGTTYTYTVRAYYGTYKSTYYAGVKITCR
jgi:transglutaminase-like putative cysteine protease